MGQNEKEEKTRRMTCDIPSPYRGEGIRDLGFGIGYRPVHFDDLSRTRHNPRDNDPSVTYPGQWGLSQKNVGIGEHSHESVSRAVSGAVYPDWLEIVTENFLGVGGRLRHHLECLRQDYPIVTHGVGLSIAAAEPFNRPYLQALKDLVRWLEPSGVTDHLCWTGLGGRQSHDLLPFPLTVETLTYVVDRVHWVQDFLGRRLCLENPSAYLQYSKNELSEVEFFNALCQKTGCGILLDINNLFVNQCNLGVEARSYIDNLDPQWVEQFHLAGHSVLEDIRIDTHDQKVPKEVWNLYRHASARFPQAATLVEWDDNIPTFPDLMGELTKARHHHHGDRVSAHERRRDPDRDHRHSPGRDRDPGRNHRLDLDGGSDHRLSRECDPDHRLSRDRDPDPDHRLRRDCDPDHRLSRDCDPDPDPDPDPDHRLCRDRDPDHRLSRDRDHRRSRSRHRDPQPNRDDPITDGHQLPIQDPTPPEPLITYEQKLLDLMTNLELVESGDAIKPSTLEITRDPTLSFHGALPATVTRGVAVYRDGYFLRLMEVLRDAYPVLHHILEDDAFDQVATYLITTRPPTNFSIDAYGGALADFLRSTPPSFDPGVDWGVLAAIAELEWAKKVVFFAGDSPVAPAAVLQMHAGEWGDVRFDMVAHMRLLTLNCRALDVLQDFHEEKEVMPPDMEPMHVLVYRTGKVEDYQVETIELTANEAQQLRYVQSGGSFGAGPWISKPSEIETAVCNLGRWQQLGLIAGRRIAPKSRACRSVESSQERSLETPV